MEKFSGNHNDEINMEHVANSTNDVIQQNKIIRGEVVTIDDEFAYVSIGTKSEGRVSIEEFEEIPEVGGIVDIMLVDSRLHDGMYVFSKTAAEREMRWLELRKLYSEGNKYITGKVKKSDNNGMVIDCKDIDAFLPFSQAADLKVKKEEWDSSSFDFKIVSIDNKKRNLVLSRKDYLIEEKERLWADFNSKYKVGDRVTGKPVRFIESGVIIDVQGVKAKINRNDISWKKVFKKKKIIKPDREMEYIILEINEDEKNILLGLKQLVEDPWLNVDERYSVDDVVSGKIVTITNFGVFVEIEEGIEGLVNASNISWTRRNVDPKNTFENGQVIETMILELNKEERRLSLGYKQIFPNPWDTIEEKFQAGSVHRRKIKKIVKYGIFVELEDDIDGMIHFSDITWDENSKGAIDQFKVNDEAEFIILEIKKDEMKISCGIKQLEKSPWELIKVKFPPRSKVSGEVSGIKPFGIFVKLEDGIEGLVHVSEVSKKKIENLEDYFKIGDQINAVVLDVNVERKRLSLSIKHYEFIEEKEELDRVLNATSPKAVTFGDIMKNKLGE